MVISFPKREQKIKLRGDTYIYLCAFDKRKTQKIIGSSESAISEKEDDSRLMRTIRASGRSDRS